MEIYKTIIAIAALALVAGCSSSEEMEAPANGRVEITATLPSPKADTRVNIAGDAFVENDEVTLYYGVPSPTNTVKGTYKYAGSAWSGSELYWDDFTRDATTNKFVGVAKNAPLSLAADKNTCEVKADQSNSQDYIASDLLVAYATSAKFTPVVLPFNHAFAHFVINITDNTTEVPFVLGASSEVTVKGITRKGIIAFHSPTEGLTGVTTENVVPTTIKTRKLGKAPDKNSYSYELILPAQSLASGITLSIESKINGKTYTYDLSNATITGITDKTQMLIQGQTTTLNLSITKTDIGAISASLTDWVATSASDATTPENYPILEIGDADDLSNIINKPGEDFAGKTIKLTGDIDASKLRLPIGQCPIPFRGIFDGQGYTISNVILTGDTPAYMGLFGCTEGATIMNLNVKGVSITNKNQSSSTATGALIGYAVDTKVLNCHIKDGAVTATYDNVGGLIGYANGCTVDLSSSAATVTGNHNYAGGLMGEALLTTVSNSYATGNVTLCKSDNTPAGYYAGGLVGYFYGDRLTDCYAWGNSSCARYMGGLLGACGNVKIESCYAAGTVSDDTGGGLVGITEQLKGSNVKYCYWNAKAVTKNTQTNGVGAGTKIESADNISFVLTETPVSMEPVTEGLNKFDGAWELGTGTLKQGSEAKTYALPLLLNNAGSATKENLVVIEKRKANE